MLVPLNNKERQDLCLSVLRLKEGYSVAIVKLVNDANLFETVQSYRCNETDRFDDNGYIFKSNICTTNYNVISGANLYDCIEQCLAQLD